jgi:hypothetical protein
VDFTVTNLVYLATGNQCVFQQWTYPILNPSNNFIGFFNLEAEAILIFFVQNLNGI